MEVKTKYTIGESVIVRHYPRKLRDGYDFEKQEKTKRSGDTIDPNHVRTNEWIWIECTVEEIHISEGMGHSRFRHDVKYKLRTNRAPLKRIIKEKGEDKWFPEDDVYKDMEHVIRRQEFENQLPKYLK